MPAILPSLRIDRSSILSRFFMPHQIHWIQAEDALHAQGKQAVILAEKSVRIGWTHADAFKNVRKRLCFKNRDYLFATKDYPSALEYMRLCQKFAEVFNLARSIISHGEEFLKVPLLDQHGRPSSFTEEIKMGVIKFDNGSRIIAFSAHPQAMAVYGGDVGLDEFAKHENARLLWETAQGRITWGFDLAVWSSHDGQDTLFYQFAKEARAACRSSVGVPPASSEGAPPAPPIENQNSKFKNEPNNPPIHQSTNPWNLYFRVTMPDAIQLGLLDVINRTQATRFTHEQFLADCRARSGSDEIYQQAYLCNPIGAASSYIIPWSAIERCREDYPIERVHFEANDIPLRFGEFHPYFLRAREEKIERFLQDSFAKVLRHKLERTKGVQFRLGFDVAASGRGDLAAFYIDEVRDNDLWLRALLTCRTDDWHFIKTVLFYFLDHLKGVQAAGDESGLGRQICWEAAERYSGRFLKVNFTSRKSALGFALMNQLTVAEKHFPKSHPDIAADFFALRKTHNGIRWAFSESHNSLNPASHCDIAWAAALATYAHSENKWPVFAAVA